ncbi:MAG TPA: SDR family oxidoreductase, partial [Acidimicrobiales bacterium]|nr:SDR family oxidoreductase [Acidimicrobiales bacterium]
RTREPRDGLSGSLAETAARVERHGRRAGVVVADLTDERARARVVPAAVEALGGPLDILVNNAAAAIYGDVAHLTLKRRRLLFEANVHAPLDLAQAAVPAMRAVGRGWIVNLTSKAARPWPGPPFVLGPNGTTIAVYGASKAALDRVTNALGVELVGTGVRVNGVAPRAAVLTEGARGLVGATVRPDQVESLEEMVEAVVALCACPEDVTGQTHVSLDLIAEWGLDVRALDAGVLDR